MSNEELNRIIAMADGELDMLKDTCHDLYEKNKELEQRIQKAIEYIETIKDNTPSSTRKDFTKMILINYEQLLDILKGDK